MTIRKGVSTPEQWFIDCDVDGDRVHVSVCWDFQRPAGIIKEPTEEAILARATRLGWIFMNRTDGVRLTFCPGCVPLSVKVAETTFMRRYLLGLASPMTSRELALRAVRRFR